jgi:hypothetical protein
MEGCVVSNGTAPETLTTMMGQPREVSAEGVPANGGEGSVSSSSTNDAEPTPCSLSNNGTVSGASTPAMTPDAANSTDETAGVHVITDANETTDHILEHNKTTGASTTNNTFAANDNSIDHPVSSQLNASSPSDTVVIIKNGDIGHGNGSVKGSQHNVPIGAYVTE